jgi:YgiT-type zinc finger domain-containing protein
VVQPGYSEMIFDLQYRVRINNVPANLCTQCGEVFIAGRVASEVNRMIEDVEGFAKSQPQLKESSIGKEIAIAV